MNSQTRHLLLVDDEEGIRNVLAIVLADMGYTVDLAENGEAALDQFKKRNPPIVITDIKMPGMDGLALLQAIKAERPDTEVIMITGHGEIDLAIKSLKFEASDYITKPINNDALEIALERSLERIRLRRQLAAYTENLEQLVKEKTEKLIKTERMAAIGQTVAGLSHTIKNITGGLKGGAYVIEKGLELSDMTYLRQGWAIAKKNVDRIALLSGDLLNYAKTTNIHFVRSDPNEPLREVADLLKAKAGKQDISLTLTLDPDLPELYFDPEAIYHCILNLVTNALDACQSTNGSKGPEDPLAKKQIRLQSRSVEGWGVEYEVRDNGCGMDQSILNKLFNQFFSTKGSKGTGIGLMMTKSIVEYHKGSIEVASTRGQGSVFTIRLPLRMNESGPSPNG